MWRDWLLCSFSRMAEKICDGTLPEDLDSTLLQLLNAKALAHERVKALHRALC